MNADEEMLLETLFRQYFKKLTLLAYARVKKWDVSEEIVQDTFHEALLHIGVLREHPNQAGWLVNTTKYKILEYERRRNQMLHRFLEIGDIADLAAPQDEIEQAIDRTDHTVETLLETMLKPDERYLLKRFVFDQATHKEIAEELNISVSASQKRLERIRKKLEINYREHKNIL